MRFNTFIENLLDCGWAEAKDIDQRADVKKLWASIYPTAAELEEELLDFIESNERLGKRIQKAEIRIAELEQRLAEADELKEKFKTAMATYELTGFDDSLWELLDAITKVE